MAQMDGEFQRQRRLLAVESECGLCERAGEGLPYLLQVEGRIDLTGAST